MNPPALIVVSKLYVASVRPRCAMSRGHTCPRPVRRLLRLACGRQKHTCLYHLRAFARKNNFTLDTLARCLTTST